MIRFLLLLLGVLGMASPGLAVTYYVDAERGDDANHGRTPTHAWQSLTKAGEVKYGPGDRLLLRNGSVFKGSLRLRAKGTKNQPVVVRPYGSAGDGKPIPRIDSAGWLAGIRVVNSTHVEISGIEITSDGGKAKEKAARKRRYGVLVRGDSRHGSILLRKLYIHDIFASQPVPHEGANKTSNMGIGIGVPQQGKKRKLGSGMQGLTIEDCRIEVTGFTGIRMNELRDVRILNNRLARIGGPGIQPGFCENVLMRGNVVDGSGSSADPRMHARGSGTWPFSCRDVLIEQNRFMHARGKMDSCGAHIDFNCTNVIVQHNLSLDNEGGFIEILGNNRNCAYRYNLSINDGSRRKGRSGARQDGKTLWLSGYVGKGNAPSGPFNSYIYNNTIYVGPGIDPAIAIVSTAEGALVANNIFYVDGIISAPSRKKWNDPELFQNVFFRNNLVTRPLPETIFNESKNPIEADPMFRNPGGFDPADYLPGNAAAVKGRGAPISKLPGDPVGLVTGFEVGKDMLGNRVRPGAPDIGALVCP